MLFRYAVRTALARKLFSALIIGSIALVIAGSAITRAYVHGLMRTVSVGGQPRNVILLRRDMFNLSLSLLTTEVLNAVKALPELEEVNGVALASPEIDVFVTVDSQATRGRAVDDVAFLVHDSVRLVSGRHPVGEEVIVGQGLVARHPGLNLGSTVQLQIPRVTKPQSWPVVGIFSDGGHQLEREVWFPREAFLVAGARKGRGGADIGYVVVRVRSQEDVRPLIKKLSNSPALPLAAFVEQDYYDEMLGRLNAVLPIVFGIVVVLIAVAISMVSNLLHSSMASRRVEFFTLWAMGFRPASLKLLVFWESFFYAGVGTLLGAVMTISLTSGRDAAALLGGDFQFSFSYSVQQIGELCAFGVVIGVLSMLHPLLLMRGSALASQK